MASAALTKAVEKDWHLDVDGRRFSPSPALPSYAFVYN